jgi:hypothetical protein
VRDEPTADLSDIHNWEPAEKFDDFALVCCGQPHLTLRTDPDSFSLTQRVGRMGPVTLSEFIVGSDVTMDCGEECNTYRVIVLQAGRTECVHRGLSVAAGLALRRFMRPAVSPRRDGSREAKCFVSGSTRPRSMMLSAMHSVGR